MVVQKLQEHDWERDNILQNVLISDEAHFYLSGCVNKQNSHYWAGHNPRQLHERPLHSELVIVWSTVVKFGVWDPYFF